MKYLKLFENYNPQDPSDVKIGKAINTLYNSVRVSPSLKHIVKDVEKIEDLFNIYGKEKSSEIVNKLNQLEPEINKWNMDDEEYLMKDDRGLKSAPTSQLKVVLSLLEKYQNQPKDSKDKSVVNKDPQTRYKELLAEWKDNQKKLGKNTTPGQGTRTRLMRQAKEGVK